MNNVAVAFEILNKGKSAPSGQTKAIGDLVVDAKIYFTRKVRWVKDGPNTADLENSTFARVVS